MKIKDMPTNEMPREKMLALGEKNLSNRELISIVLRSGVKDSSVMEIADNILSTVDSINDLSNIGVRQLSNIKGMGQTKALTLLSAIELGRRVYSKEVKYNMVLNNKDIVHDVFKSSFKNMKQEKCIAIFLDVHKRLIAYKIISIGTVSSSLVHPREVFKEAIKYCASSIILMHNHPSNDLTPSKKDIELTQNIVESGKIVGIPLLDHLITNGEECYSFYENSFKNS